MFSWRRDHPVTRMVREYILKAEECMGLFRRSFETYFACGLGAEFDEMIEATHIAESFGDDLRRRIERELFARALVPESRGDILHLLERVDRVPSRADTLLHEMQAEMLRLPPALVGKFRQLVHINCETFEFLARAVQELFTGIDKVPDLAQEIDKRESSSDHLEREILRLIFSDAGIAPDQRILLRDLVLQIGSVSDLSENAADTLMIITVKRMV